MTQRVVRCYCWWYWGTTAPATATATVSSKCYKFEVLKQISNGLFLIYDQAYIFV